MRQTVFLLIRNSATGRCDSTVLLFCYRLVVLYVLCVQTEHEKAIFIYYFIWYFWSFGQKWGFLPVSESADKAQLCLFGSSKNGFGFRDSDLDICMTLEGHETAEVSGLKTRTHIYIHTAVWCNSHFLRDVTPLFIHCQKTEAELQGDHWRPRKSTKEAHRWIYFFTNYLYASRWHLCVSRTHPDWLCSPFF